jgi:F-type H+-transporting ATPase subunit b
MRLLLLAIVSLSLLVPISAQEGKAAEKKEEADLGIWRWANFLILGALIGYGLAKFMPSHLSARSAEIQKGIAEAQRLKAEAERRAAEIEKRMLALGAEVEKLRTDSKAEMQREGDRIRQETAGQMQRLAQQSEAEIESAGVVAKRQLKDYAANLALDLAEQRVRGRLDTGAASNLVDDFIGDLARREAKN